MKTMNNNSLTKLDSRNFGNHGSSCNKFRQPMVQRWLLKMALVAITVGFLVGPPTFAKQNLLGNFFQGSKKQTAAAEAEVLQTPAATKSFDSTPTPTQAANTLRSLHSPQPLRVNKVQQVAPVREGRIHIPVAEVGTPGKVELSPVVDGRISLVVRDASLSRVLSMFAQSMHLNIVASNGIDAVVSVTLDDVPVERALSAILAVANYTWVERDGIIYVTSMAGASQVSAEIQGRIIRVISLDYVESASVAEAIKGFLSPAGQVFFTESDETNNRRAQETIVVEDVPNVVARIEAFITQIDIPPRQVAIEAHILQVDLNDNRRNGVNFNHMFQLMGNGVSIRSVGLANPVGTPAFFASVTGGNLTTLVELLKTTTDAKSLANPKITVINEQTARIHIGDQLGYKVVTTTETSSLESIDFLDVGVVLTLTPRIGKNNQVLLHVKPEVSSGQINAETGTPEEQTTELETSVMLRDGYGMVIGGLIQETDSVVQSKVPYLGDAYLIGRLFQKQVVKKERSEIIIVLIPRILPVCGESGEFEQGELIRAQTQLFEGPLLRKERPWLPKLPDAVSNPRTRNNPLVGKTYPYPAVRIEDAGTPQPQAGYHVPPKPGANPRGLDPACDSCLQGTERAVQMLPQNTFELNSVPPGVNSVEPNEIPQPYENNNLPTEVPNEANVVQPTAWLQAVRGSAAATNRGRQYSALQRIPHPQHHLKRTPVQPHGRAIRPTVKIALPQRGIVQQTPPRIVRIPPVR